MEWNRMESSESSEWNRVNRVESNGIEWNNDGRKSSESRWNRVNGVEWNRMIE